MNETRKLAAILAADVVGFSRLAGADEEGVLGRLRALRSDVTDPTIAVHHGRVVKRTGDGLIVEFRSVVDAVRCAIEIQAAILRSPETDASRVLLAACYGQMGLIDEAPEAWREALSINSAYSLEQRRNVLPYEHPADFERIVEGLRKAGLPEG
jgi:hypothetical protein